MLISFSNLWFLDLTYARIVLKRGETMFIDLAIAMEKTWGIYYKRRNANTEFGNSCFYSSKVVSAQVFCIHAN